MKRFLFPFFFMAFSLCATGDAYADDAELNIDSELVEILDSFDSENGHNPYAAPKWSELTEAKGTLVFFDNSNSSGKKPKIGGNIKTSPSNALQKTLFKAKQRLFGQKTNKTATAPKVQPQIMPQQNVPPADIVPDETPQQKQPRFFSLNYEGEKTLAFIPPDTFIEVPFLKHIPYFFSRIEILSNGTLKITETIERVVEPDETDFKGIDRIFPKYHKDRTGRMHRTHLMILEALADNKPVKAKLLPDFEGIRVSVHEDTAKEAGTHKYSLTYLVSNKVVEFKNNAENAETPDFKELIWDITGTHWDLPITHAGAVIIFPPNSKLYAQSGITGGSEGYGTNLKIKKDKNNDLSVALTFPLAPHEGLTVLTNWGEREFSEAFENGKLDRFIIEHGTAAVSLIALLFVFSYYMVTLAGQKKNRKKATVKAAPMQKGDLTPAVLNYALTKKISDRSLLIILLNMASKGFLSFGEDGNGTLLLIKETDKVAGLTPLEKKIAKQLFSKDGTSFAVTNANTLKLARIMSVVEKNLIKEYRKKFTVFPQGYFWFGILMAIIAVVSVSSMSLFPLITAATSLISVVILIPASFIGGKIYTAFCDGEWKANKLKTLRLLVLFLPFPVCLAGLFIYYAVQTTLLSAVFFFLLLMCIGVFKTLLRTPSALGESLLENIEGYKLYLSSQDDTLLGMMRNATAKIKALYSKHLPFAVALDQEKPWTNRFVAFSEKENQLKPDWYKGKLPFAENFIESLAAEFNKAFPKKNAAAKSGSAKRARKLK